MKIGEYRQVGPFRELVVSRGGFIPSTQPGETYIQCCECGERPAHNECNVLVQSKGGNLLTGEEPEFNTYTFCGNRCRTYWYNESRANASLTGQLSW